MIEFPKTENRISQDVLDVVRARVRIEFQSALCEALIYRAVEEGTTIKFVADRTGRTYADVRSIICDGTNDIDEISDVLYALGFQVGVSIKPMPKDGENVKGS